MHARRRRVRVTERPTANPHVPTRLETADRVRDCVRVFRTSQRSAARLIVAGAARRQGPHRFRGVRRRLQTLCPLDRALGRPPLLASVAEQRFGTGRYYQLQSEPIVCPLAVTADTKARITTGRRRLACERRGLTGDVIAPLNIRSNCAADASFPSPVSPRMFRTPTAGSPSATSSDDSYGQTPIDAALRDRPRLYQPLTIPTL
jgi:hypothetical protein